MTNAATDITRADVVAIIEANTAMWESLDRHQRLEWLKNFWEQSHDGLATIITSWEDHCDEAGHLSASRGGQATYSSTHDKTAAICCVPGCDWFIAAIGQ